MGREFRERARAPIISFVCARMKRRARRDRACVVVIPSTARTSGEFVEHHHHLPLRRASSAGSRAAAAPRSASSSTIPNLPNPIEVKIHRISGNFYRHLKIHTQILCRRRRRPVIVTMQRSAATPAAKRELSSQNSLMRLEHKSEAAVGDWLVVAHRASPALTVCVNKERRGKHKPGCVVALAPFFGKLARFREIIRFPTLADLTQRSQRRYLRGQ